jgi:capsular exopolysaccharide synthesis family protein
VIGGVLGAIIGLLIAVGREAVDRRVRAPETIAAELELPILTQVSAASLGYVAHIGSRGDPHGMDAFRILRTNLSSLAAGRELHAIAVTSAVPEEGKTTVAASLACASGAAGKRTLLVECDLRRPTLGALLGIPDAPGLSDYLTENATPQEILQIVPVTDGPSTNGSAGGVGARKIVCITAGTPVAHPTELLAAPRFAEFIGAVRDSYDLVVLDTCPLLPVADTLEMLPLVDGIVLCVRSHRTPRELARAGKNAIDRFPQLPAGLVITGITKRDRKEYGYSGYSGYYD